MASALSGIRILDLTGLGPATIAAMMLGDMGAEVIKIDMPPGGDKGVGGGLAANPPGPEQERMTAHQASGRNKKSMALNLKSEAGKVVFQKLAGSADVIIESFRPGVMDRLGVGYGAIAKANPKVIFCSVTGYGQDGPYRNFPGHDPDYSAMGGVLGLIGDSPDQPPVFALNIAADMTAVLYAVIGTLLALSARQRTGRGQLVDISMTDGVVFLQTGIPGASEYFQTGVVPRRGQTMGNGNQPFGAVYQTKDGKYLTVCPVEPRFWYNFCNALGRQDLVPHHYAPSPKKEEVFSELKRILSTRTRDEWFELLSKADVPVGKVLDLDEVFRDPQILHRKMLLELDHPKLGKVKQIGFPVKLSDTPGEVRTMPASLGQHTDEILKGLGYSQSQIRELRQGGVVH